jgi:hypothetical protein
MKEPEFQKIADFLHRAAQIALKIQVKRFTTTAFYMIHDV